MVISISETGRFVKTNRETHRVFCIASDSPSNLSRYNICKLRKARQCTGIMNASFERHTARRKNARYDILNIRSVRSADILPSRAAESFDTAFGGDRPGQYAIFRQRFNRCIITARREKSPAGRDFFTSDVLLCSPCGEKMPRAHHFSSSFPETTYFIASASIRHACSSSVSEGYVGASRRFASCGSMP